MEKRRTYQGFETWWSSVRMTIKMHTHIIMLLFLLQVTATVAYIYYDHGDLWGQALAILFRAVVSFDFNFVSGELWSQALSRLLDRALDIYLVAVLFSLLLYPVLLHVFKRRAERQSKDTHIRGARLLSGDELNRAIRKDRERAYIAIGNVRMPVSAEPKHMFVIGRPGTGKTVAMRGVIDSLRHRDNKAVIYDFKGDYLCKFYDPERDLIFNPLDTRSLGWNLFNDIETPMDIDSIATSLVPPAASSADPFWNDAARDVFAGLLRYLFQRGMRTNADIWQAVSAPAADIAGWLKDTKGGERGYRYIEDASSKQAMSVLAVMMQYAKSFEYMTSMSGGFSLKRWLGDDTGGFIFVTSYADIEATLRPILSLFVDTLGRKLLTMPDDYNRRVFFMLDEFGTLQRMSTIQKLLTLARSKGGSCWLGIQDVGQLDKIYTHSGRQTIINACGSNLIFSVADPDTAKFLSEKIGEREYYQMEETLSMGVTDTRDGTSLRRRKVSDKLILPSEIQGLRDLHGLIKFPGYDIAQVELRYKHYPDVAASFICRSDLSLDEAYREQMEIEARALEVTMRQGDGEVMRQGDRVTGRV